MYKENINEYITLTPEALTKLKMLSLVEYAKHNESYEYSFLLSSLDLATQPDLEDLVNQAISNDLLKGKCDSKEQRVYIRLYNNYYSVFPSNIEKASDIDSYLENIDKIEKFLQEEINYTIEKEKQMK